MLPFFVHGQHCSYQVAPLSIITKLATRWRHLHLLQALAPYGATCIGCTYSYQEVPLALGANLATRWCYLYLLQIWPPGGTSCVGGTSCFGGKFGYQVVPFALGANLATSQVVPGGAIWIGYTFGRQVAPLVSIASLATRWRHLPCLIAMDCPIASISWCYVGQNPGLPGSVKIQWQRQRQYNLENTLKEQH